MRSGLVQAGTRLGASLLVLLASRLGAGAQDCGFGPGGGMENDCLDGEAVLTGPRGDVLARHPQLSVRLSRSLPAN